MASLLDVSVCLPALRQERSGLPSSCAFLSTHATLFVDPGRPSESSPRRFLCIGFWAVKTIAICIWTIGTVTPNNGAISRLQEVRSSLLPTSFPVYASMMLFESWCQRFVFGASAPLVEVAGIPSSTPRFSLFDGNSSNRLSCLLHHCNTRYEWLVRPCSAGTFTLQETPSFAWRTNGLAQRQGRGDSLECLRLCLQAALRQEAAQPLSAAAGVTRM